MGLLSSPRRRRRLVRLAIALGGAGVIAVAALVLQDRNSAPSLSSRPTPGGAAVPVVERQVPLSRRDRAGINRTLDAFIPTAVDRQDPGRGWDLSTPGMRSGPRRQWLRGDLPVYPFPARGLRFHGWTLNFSYPNDVSLDLLLQPRRGANVGPIAFTVEVKRIGGRWLVDWIAPTAVFSKPGERSSILASPDFGAPGDRSTLSADRPRLGPIWFAAPGAVLGLALFIPLAFWLVGWRRTRRASRAYLRSRSEA